MLTEDEAIAIAKAEVASRDYPWLEPPTAILRQPWFGDRRWWVIESGANGNHPQSFIEIDARTGEILKIERRGLPR